MSKGDLKKKTKVGAYWQMANQLSNNGLMFVINIIMARLLMPEDFGVVAIPMVFLAIAEIFIEAGFSSALVRKDEVSESDMSTAFIFSISVGVICYLVLFFLSPLIAGFYQEPRLINVTRVAAIAFLITPLSTPQTVILKRKIDFKTPAKVAVISRILAGALGISLAYYGFGLWSLVYSNLAGVFLTFAFNWISVRWYPKAGWSKDSFNYLFGYGSKMVLTYLLSRVYMNIAPLFIGKYCNTEQLGIYNNAHRYTIYPSRFFIGIVQNVTFPVLCQIKNDDNTLALSYRKMIKITTFLVFPLMLLLAVVAEPLVRIFLTDKWIGCVPFIQIMCLSIMWSPVHSLNLNLLLIKGRSDLFLRLEIIKDSIGVCIMLITLPMGIIPFLWGRVLSSIICLYINTYYTGKIIGVGFFRQMGDVLPSFILTMIIATATYSITSCLDNSLFRLTAGILLGTILYVVISLLLRFPEWKEVKYMLKKN